jgi:hypothetical protein
MGLRRIVPGGNLNSSIILRGVLACVVFWSCGYIHPFPSFYRTLFFHLGITSYLVLVVHLFWRSPNGVVARFCGEGCKRRALRASIAQHSLVHTVLLVVTNPSFSLRSPQAMCLKVHCCLAAIYGCAMEDRAYCSDFSSYPVRLHSQGYNVTLLVIMRVCWHGHVLAGSRICSSYSRSTSNMHQTKLRECSELASQKIVCRSLVLELLWRLETF